MGSGAGQRVIAALEAGQPVLLPTDTVYGLAASAQREDHATRVYRLKGREATQPTALLAPSIERALRLPAGAGRGRAHDRPRAPAGPVHADPPEPGAALSLADRRAHRRDRRARARAARGRAARGRRGRLRDGDQRERPGWPDPVTLDDVPRRIRDAVAAELDLGPLPGTPSTVIDFTGDEPS